MGERKRLKRSTLEASLGVLRQLMGGRQLVTSDLMDAGYAPSEATARRYLRVLDQELPWVKREPGRPARWRFEWPREAGVDPRAAIAASMAKRLLPLFEGTRLAKALDSLVGGIAGTEELESNRAFFTKTRLVTTLGVPPGTVDRLVDAIAERHLVDAVYRRFDGRSEKLILAPYTMVFADAGAYCLAKRLKVNGREVRDESVRLLNLARFHGFSATTETFEYPHGFDPAAEFKDCFGVILPSTEERARGVRDMVVRFDPRWHFYLRTSPWHRSQGDPRPAPGGNWDVTLKLFETFEFRGWVRGLGREAKLLLPKDVRRRVEAGE